MSGAIRVGLLGLGTVGQGVYDLLSRNATPIAGRAGGPIIVRRVLVSDLTKRRDVSVPPDMLTTDPEVVIGDPEIDVVVELIGCRDGVEPALRYMREAIVRGKHVVTANKEIIAKYGSELFRFAAARGVLVGFEAAVAGGIPIIKSLRECLAANRVEMILGIINGTTNYMLTRMAREGADFESVLRDAQAQGYAEADPTSDVEGYDAAYKLAILASLAFETSVRVEDVYREGITRITAEDLSYARELGCTIKLLAIAKQTERGVEVRVHPTMIPVTHPLAAVNDVFNAIFVRGDAVGELMFYGRGAGRLPTASAVVADLVEIAQALRQGGGPWMPPRDVGTKSVLPIDETVSRYYILTKVIDRPGVLAAIATAFGQEGVSIESVIQKGRREDPVSLVFVTHEVKERNVRAALAKIALLPVVRAIANVIRVEGD